MVVVVEVAVDNISCRFRLTGVFLTFVFLPRIVSDCWSTVTLMAMTCAQSTNLWSCEVRQIAMIRGHTRQKLLN